MTRSQKFEITIYPQLKSDFFSCLTETERELAQSLLNPSVEKGDFTAPIELLKKIEGFIENSKAFETVKLEWWKDFLTGNMPRIENGKIMLINLDGTHEYFDSIEDVYSNFINQKNKVIWEPYDNVYKKLLIEWWTEEIIKALSAIAKKDKISFIYGSLLELKKQQYLEAYTKYKANEHLNYYQKILELEKEKLSDGNEFEVQGTLFNILTSNDKVLQLRNSLSENKIDIFFSIVKSIYASIPYNLHKSDEAYYHAIFHVIITLVSDFSASETATNLGKIDSFVETNNYIFIFEFKLNEAVNALQQIRKKK